MFGKKKGDCCDSCDTCAAPACNTCAAPVCNTCAAPACDSCDSGCGKWSGGRVRGLFGKHKGGDCCDSCEATTCGSCGSSCDTGCDDCGKKRWGGRLRGMFGKKKGGDCCDSCDTCNTCDTGCANGGCGGAISGAPIGIQHGAPIGAPIAPKGEPIGPPKEAPKAMPKGDSGKQAQVSPTTTPYLAAPETKSPFELSRQYETRVNNAADYSSLTGQLFFVHADGGLWVLRYAPVWKEDRFGGSVVLARDLEMITYREGDLVQVRGEVLNQGRSTKYLGGPLYRGASISLVDRQAN